MSEQSKGEVMDVDDEASTARESSKPTTKQQPTGQQTKRQIQQENLPWVEKYRPNSLDELIAHEEIIKTIQRLLEAKRLPHLLFYGPPGTGKTSTIMAIAKMLYGKSYNNFVMELNASDERGIDVVREQIKDFASTRKIFSTGFKLIILDEADQLTSDAQAALRRVIEKYTKNTRFCLICNYVNKIIPAIQSRCTRFRFSPLKKSQIVDRLQSVADTENVNLTKDGLDAIIRLSGGDMRKCLNVLQSTHMSNPEKVDATSVYLCTGNPLPEDIRTIVHWMFNETFTAAYENINKLKTVKGLALVDILRDVHQYVIRIEISEEAKVFLLDKMSDIEYRMSFGAHEKLQLAALVGAFQIARESLASQTTEEPKTCEQIANLGAIVV